MTEGDTIRGLSAAEAAARLRQEGHNELPTAVRRTELRILLEVVRQPMFALLVAGGGVYLLLGDRVEAVLLLAFASLSVLITIVQESRSERVLEALRNLASPRALVVRDGERRHVAGRDVVRGDLLIVSEGDRIAADATLIAAHDLMLDESLLTGESVATPKRARAAVAAVDAPRAAPDSDDVSRVFAGTLVVRGTARARVYATGTRTEMGKIGKALRTIETEQPHLARQLSRLIRDFAVIGALAGGSTVLLFGFFRGTWLQALLGGIALGMSLLPEEVPLVMTVFMAMGAWRISRARVLTRRAAAIETLGATTVLCTDKTGTLTENRMSVAALHGKTARWEQHVGGTFDAELCDLVRAARFASAPEPTDPMDVAVHALAARHLPEQSSAESAPRVLHAYGLRSDLLAVGFALLDPATGESTVYAKGAVEAIGQLCGWRQEDRAEVESAAASLAARGVRVLAVARSASTELPPDGGWPGSLRAFAFEYQGLIGFADPLRANVPAAVAECRSAGIRVVMITGDYPATAQAIGREAGLDTAQLLTGDELDQLGEAALAERVKDTSIFARIRPAQKLRIVESLKAGGEVVAMTGDGVNDAPAIKAANIGIAMGGRGTDVARETSAIVLLDDDFGSIVATIRLGRRIYDNLRKAIEYIVAVHIPIAGLALLPLLLGLPLVLTPVHIAFLQMIIDPACSMVFEAEPAEADVMRRAPRDPRSRLLPRHRIGWAVLQGLISLSVLAGLLVTAATLGMPEADLRTLVFAALVLINMGLILVNRSFDSSLVNAIVRPNKTLWTLLGGVLMLLAVTIFWTPARTLFKFGALHWNDLGICAAIGALSLLGLETIKARWFRDPRTRAGRASY